MATWRPLRLNPGDIIGSWNRKKLQQTPTGRSRTDSATFASCRRCEMARQKAREPQSSHTCRIHTYMNERTNPTFLIGLGWTERETGKWNEMRWNGMEKATSTNSYSGICQTWRISVGWGDVIGMGEKYGRKVIEFSRLFDESGQKTVNTSTDVVISSLW